MFALALWDGRRRALIAARDRAGEKPLYYTLTPQGLRLASEIKALLSRPEVDRTLDHEALDQFLTYEYIIAPRTIFKAIHKLPPAHYLVYKDGEITVKRYWDAADVQVRAWTEAEAAEALRETLRRGGAQPDDVGRADRALSVRRHRLERGRDHAARRAGRLRGVELQHGLRRRQLQRAAVRAGSRARCAGPRTTKGP